VQRGEYDKIVPYSTSVGFKIDYSTMLSQFLFNNPQGALDLAKGLVNAEGGPLVDIQSTVEAFFSSNRVQETTAFLLEELLKLLMPLCRPLFLPTTIVRKLCEKAGMWQRAAEHYTDINDIKRFCKNSHQMAPEFVVEYFGKLNREQIISLLKDMLSRGPANVQVCVEVAKKYNEELGAKELFAVFEQNKAIEGLYYFLGAIVNFSEDPVVHFKYIQASGQLGQFKEAERVCRDSNI